MRTRVEEDAHPEVAEMPVPEEEFIPVRFRPLPFREVPNPAVEFLAANETHVDEDPKVMAHCPVAKAEHTNDRTEVVSREAEQVVVDTSASRIPEHVRALIACRDGGGEPPGRSPPELASRDREHDQGDRHEPCRARPRQEPRFAQNLSDPDLLPGPDSMWAPLFSPCSETEPMRSTEDSGPHLVVISPRPSEARHVAAAAYRSAA